MNNKGEVLTKNRIGFEKLNIALGILYKEWYEFILNQLSDSDGINLELGCGASFINEIIKNVKKSDVFFNANTDLKIDAMEVGLKFENKISNLILVNVFHHISNPELFLRSAEKSLLRGGRIIMVEPSNNIWSRLVYKLVGHERFDTEQITWKFESNDPLIDSNQALSWIIFKRDYKKFKKLFPEFSILKRKSIMPFSYLMSGGHTYNTKVGKIFIKIIRKIERIFFDNQFGIFDLICIEKI
jgi:SAM-dependent methyltransferase